MFVPSLSWQIIVRSSIDSPFMKPQIESFFDDRSAVDWGGYTWGPQLFPEPEALLTSLANWCACFLRLFAPVFCDSLC
jgi:hypothetical protein